MATFAERLFSSKSKLGCGIVLGAGYQQWSGRCLRTTPYRKIKICHSARVFIAGRLTDGFPRWPLRCREVEVDYKSESDSRSGEGLSRGSFEAYMDLENTTTRPLRLAQEFFNTIQHVEGPMLPLVLLYTSRSFLS